MKFFMVFFSFVYCAFAYNFLDIHNQNINIKNTGYFYTDVNLSAQEAYAKYLNKQTTPFPNYSKSFGINNNTYWFFFEVDANSSEKLYLDNITTNISHEVLYTFKNNQIIDTQKSGFFIPIDERNVKTLPIRFNIQSKSNDIVYVLEMQSLNAKTIAFILGDAGELDKQQYIGYLINISTFIVVLTFVIYNLFLYAFLKDTMYIYYSLYIAFMSITMLLSCYFPIIGLNEIWTFAALHSLFASFAFYGATFFTIKFLQLDKKQSQMLLLLLTLYIFVNIVKIFYINLFGLSLIVMQAIFIYILYITNKLYFVNNFKPALYYLIGTGTVILLTVILILMYFGVFPFTVYTNSIFAISPAIDAVLFSIALAHRIEILREEKEFAQQQLIAHTRFTTIGEVTSNIAHQWRQPLAKLSSLMTNLDATLRFDNKIDKKQLEDAIISSNSIIKYMSQTINTFQNFFSKPQDGNIKVLEAISDIIVFITNTLKNSNITINISIKEDIIAKGNTNEFNQAVLNILNNAIDAINEKNIVKPFININAYEKDKNIVIEISDNAGGIHNKNLQEIFEPYYSTKGLNGSGLGLFITKTIIANRLNGSIDVVNTNNGVIFTIVLLKLNN